MLPRTPVLPGCHHLGHSVSIGHGNDLFDVATLQGNGSVQSRISVNVTRDASDGIADPARLGYDHP